MKLELFTSNKCANCKALKKYLKEVISEIGEDYYSVVSEKDVEQSEVMAELLMLNVDSVPVIRIGGEVLLWERIGNKTSLKKVLLEHKKMKV